MARISLKEQYDNQSVIKQIIDLGEKVDEQDEQIEQAIETAETAKTTAETAKKSADAATTKNTEQDSRLDTIEATDVQQNQEIAGILVKNAQQDEAIASIQTKDAEQDASITAIIAKNTEQDTAIGEIKAKDAEQDLSIATILDTDTKQDSAIAALQTITDTLTNEVISSVNVTDGTQNGSIMVKLADAGGRIISSPSYPWGQVAAFELKQGTEAGYVRGVLTLSDGTVIESNDFQILTIVESDVYVTSITLTPYPATGKLGGEIGYSNGNHQQIDIIDVPTAPGVTLNINDLLQRMGVAEGAINDLDVRVKAIEDTPGVGPFTNQSRGTILGSAEDGKVSANDDGTGSVSGWSDVVRSAQIADMETKTNAAATYLAKTEAAAVYETIEDAEQISVVANEAKSTAEDVQTKANGCFNSVALNESNNGLVFGTPSGASSEVAIPGGTQTIVYAKETTDTFTSQTYKKNSGYELPFMCRTDGCKSNIVGSLNIVTCEYSMVYSTTYTYIYTNCFSDSDRNTLAAQLLAGIVLPDGTYAISYTPTGGSSTLPQGNPTIYNMGRMKVVVSDGEIISTAAFYPFSFLSSSDEVYDTFGTSILATQHLKYMICEIGKIA